LAESNRLLVIGLVDKINELRAAGDESALDELLAAVKEQQADLTDAVVNGTATLAAPATADPAVDTQGNETGTGDSVTESVQ